MEISAEDRSATIRAYWHAGEAERRKSIAAGIKWEDWEWSPELRAAQDRARRAGLAQGDDQRAQAGAAVGDLMAPHLDAGMTRVQALAQVMKDREKSPRL